jgi:hypothetical protein
MTWEEYIDLFHKEQLNLVAFKQLFQCDHEVLRLVNAAIAAEREACADIAENWNSNGMPRTGVANEIRARGEKPAAYKSNIAHMFGDKR